MSPTIDRRHSLGVRAWRTGLRREGDLPVGAMTTTDTGPAKRVITTEHLPLSGPRTSTRGVAVGVSGWSI